MASARKTDFPVSKIRRFLEPGPIVLLSTAFKGETNIMTLGWHTVLGFSPSLIGCYIWDANHSFDLARKSRQCVINVPGENLIEKAIGIGTCSGRDTRKFEKFGLTPAKAAKVQAPLIKECFANFECRLVEDKLVKDYGFFIWEVVKAHAIAAPRVPHTFHYRGQGKFMISGREINLAGKFPKWFLDDVDA